MKHLKPDLSKQQPPQQQCQPMPPPPPPTVNLTRGPKPEFHGNIYLYGSGNDTSEAIRNVRGGIQTSCTYPISHDSSVTFWGNQQISRQPGPPSGGVSFDVRFK